MMVAMSEPSRTMRTGEVASRLGVSRQHVVDMCERGQLPFKRVGVHRRISEQAVSDLLEKHQESPERGSLSIWLHAAVLAQLFRDPDTVIQKARSNLARMRTTGAAARSERYLREWEKILDAGTGSIADVLLDRSDNAATLRSCTPFTGVLPSSEVAAIKAAWREHQRACGINAPDSSR